MYENAMAIRQTIDNERILNILFFIRTGSLLKRFEKAFDKPVPLLTGLFDRF